MTEDKTVTLTLTEDELLILGSIVCVGNSVLLGQANQKEILAEARDALKGRGRALAGSVSKKISDLLE